jgi:tRNA-Thr(GGU) m(6)t(6)A37 methyltransferase TsaA
MKKTFFVPIGTIYTPFRTTEGMAIQGKFDRRSIGRVRLHARYYKGLKNIKGFSHLILIYYFHREKREKIIVKPFLEDIDHGVFATRSPFRPNHMGLAIVKLKSVKPDGFEFYGVDMLDQTPLLDIKPYISYIDSVRNARNGWVKKHLHNGKIPQRARIKKNHLVKK